MNNTNIIELCLSELDIIKKCHYLEDGIKDKIITNIPTNIIKIYFDFRFNLDIQNYLHPEILMLEYGSEFNKPIDNLPLELEILKLGLKFNHPVSMLPESLEILYLSNQFNQDISNLPSGLKTLRLTGYKFNQSINSLPDSIDSIELIELNNDYMTEINKLPKKISKIVVDGKNL